MKNTLKTFNELTTLLLEKEQSEPVANFISSKDLFDTLDISLQEDPIIEEEFVKALKKIVLHTPKTATHAFFNQLFGGRNDKAVLGDLLAVILNNSMYTYKAAGPQIGIEKEIISKSCALIGWDNINSGGTIAAGGSMTNFMAMLMARDFKSRKAKNEGVSQKHTIYTSTESHYSIPKNAAFSGIGREQVRYIQTDEYGKMKISDLQESIEKDIIDGFIPTMVNATAGTTVLGAFDDIISISEICKAHNIWFHVDGAYCGSVMFSSTFKHLIKGIELVDSFSYNAHKMIGTPLTCSLLLLNDKQYLYHTFSNEADYLYQTDEDDYNPGKTSLQCGRRNDALKFWTLWKSVGTKGLESIVNKQFELANAARNYVEANPDYVLYSFEDSISVCFNYLGIPARDLCTKLYEKSQLLVGYGSFKGEEFIRLVTINAQNEKEDIINFFKLIEEFVEENQQLFPKVLKTK